VTGQTNNNASKSFNAETGEFEIKKPAGEVWFLASCVELYKDDKNMSGREAFNYLLKTGAVGFIAECWEGLHLTGPRYIIDSIDEFIKTRA
jgi:hypothetical protein